MNLVSDLDLAEVLADHRRYRPTSLAVVDGVHRLSFLELADRVGALVAAFRSFGFRPGDRLLWLGGDSFRVIESLLAVAQFGGVFCPVDHRRTDRELEAIVHDTAPAIVVGEVAWMLDAASRQRSAQVARWVPLHGVNGYEALVNAPHDRGFQRPAVPGCAPLLMLYPPVPLGKPIGVQLSRAALISESAARALRDNADRGERTLSGSVIEVCSLVSSLAAVLAGATVVLPSTVRETMRRRPPAATTHRGDVGRHLAPPSGL